MPIEIERDEVQRLVGEGARLVEVLSKRQYQQAHPAGAFNIPLAQLGERAQQELQPDQPVIVYCHDYL